MTSFEHVGLFYFKNKKIKGKLIPIKNTDNINKQIKGAQAWDFRRRFFCINQA